MAGKVYVAQTGVKFTLDTETDITGATTLTIKYIKPDATTGSWTAIEEGDPTDGVISYTVTLITELTPAGRWIFWAYVVHSDGSVSYGEATGYSIYGEGR